MTKKIKKNKIDLKENAAKLPLSGCDVVGNFTPRTYR